jgi:hypothetical protein
VIIYGPNRQGKIVQKSTFDAEKLGIGRFCPKVIRSVEGLKKLSGIYISSFCDDQSSREHYKINTLIRILSSGDFVNNNMIYIKSIKYTRNILDFCSDAKELIFNDNGSVYSTDYAGYESYYNLMTDKLAAEGSTGEIAEFECFSSLDIFAVKFKSGRYVGFKNGR